MNMLDDKRGKINVILSIFFSKTKSLVLLAGCNHSSGAVHHLRGPPECLRVTSQHRDRTHLQASRHPESIHVQVETLNYILKVEVHFLPFILVSQL